MKPFKPCRVCALLSEAESHENYFLFALDQKILYVILKNVHLPIKKEK